MMLVSVMAMAAAAVEAAVAREVRLEIVENEEEAGGGAVAPPVPKPVAVWPRRCGSWQKGGWG